MQAVSYTHLDVYKRQVEILFEEEEIELREGDTIRILPGRGHRLMNQTDERAMVLFAQESR